MSAEWSKKSTNHKAPNTLRHLLRHNSLCHLLRHNSFRNPQVLNLMDGTEVAPRTIIVTKMLTC